MEDSYVVIKVKHGDTLRRFNAIIIDNELDLTFLELRRKIVSFFNFAPDSELMLTYIDEDGDVVTLADDYDICDVAQQDVNPLRITVKLKTEKHGKPNNPSSGCSTPLMPPQVQQPLSYLNSGAYDALTSVMESLHETLVKCSTDLVSKANSSAPVIAEIVDLLSRLCSSYLGQLKLAQPEKQSSTQASASECGKAASKTKGLVDPDLTTQLRAFLKVGSEEKSPWIIHTLEKLKPEVNVEKNEVKSDDVTGNISKGSSSEALSYAAVLMKPEVNVEKNEVKSDDSKVSSSEALSYAAVLMKPEVNVEKNEVKSDDSKVSSSEALSYAAVLMKSEVNGEKNEVKSDDSKVSSSEAFSYSTVAAALSPPEVEVSVQSLTSTLPKSNLISASVNGKVCKMTDDHVSMNHLVKPQLLHINDWWAEKLRESSLTTSNLSSGAQSSATEKKINNINDAEHAPNKNGLSNPLQPASRPFPAVTDVGLNGNTGNVFHRGVCCDGCGVHPIRGPRFKSKVEEDYDLCNTCFQHNGNCVDYIRIDHPIVYPLQVPNSPQFYMGSRPKPAESKLDSQFVEDVNVWDGTIMAPLVPFTKTWRMKNNGKVPWPQKTQFVWIGGDKLSDVLSVELNFPEECLKVGDEHDVSVDFLTPELPGRYVSSWKMASPSGQHFGTCVWVLIEVDASLRKTHKEGDWGLNLNLLPEITVNKEAMVQNKQLKLNSSKKPEELAEQTEVGLQQNAEHELKFPINNSLLVSNRASNFVPYDDSYVSHPSWDISAPPMHTAPSAQPQSPLVTTNVPDASGSAMEFPENLELENILLKRLHEMGFDLVDLNKEILKLTGYDLAWTLDVLSGDGDAKLDGMFQELHEMGFYDKKMNKMLLGKNN